jgi:membrane protease subunit HflK
MVRYNEFDKGSADADSKRDDWRNRLDDDSFEYFVRNNWEKYGKKIRNVTAGIGLGILALASIYTVPGDSKGVVTTFGKYTSTAGPGINLKIPFVQKVTKVQDQAIFSEAFGFRTKKAGVKSDYIGVPEITSGTVSDGDLAKIVEGEGLTKDGDLAKKAADVLRGEYLMLSGDLSMADLEWVIQYQITDPVAYTFNIKTPQKTLRDISEATMRIVVGDASIDEILTTGRRDIEIYARKKLQDKLDIYNSGMLVKLVQLQSSNPPERVRPSFNAVNTAGQKKTEKHNNAQAQYNKEVPRMRGDSAAVIQQAEGYASERVNNALGDVARFKQIYGQYKNAPAITRMRMYLETMPEVLKDAKDIYYIEDNSGLMLKKLDLNAVGGAK